jgi:hypothetical protein
MVEENKAEYDEFYKGVYERVYMSEECI